MAWYSTIPCFGAVQYCVFFVLFRIVLSRTSSTLAWALSLCCAKTRNKLWGGVERASELWLAVAHKLQLVPYSRRKYLFAINIYQTNMKMSSIFKNPFVIIIYILKINHRLFNVWRKKIYHSPINCNLFHIQGEIILILAWNFYPEALLALMAP